MSDLDQLDPRLDAAFESLTRELARTHGPGAAAAMATARTRRRTNVGAVALATLVVVGGGLTAPQLLSSDVPPAGPATQQASPRPVMLPEWTGIDLEGALHGWQSPTKRAATSSPNLLCLHDRLDGVTTSISGGGGSPWGLSYRVAGYPDPEGGPANVELVLDQLRACTSSVVEIETLPNGVHVATYDTGGPEPDNAIWVAANGDRAGMIAVERADRALPDAVRQDVADALHEILHLPWDR